MRKDWEVKKLGDVCYSLNGLWTGKNPPFVSVSVIRNTNFSKDCKLVLNDVAIIEVERNQYLSRKLIYGDIIIEKSGGSDKQPVGRPVIFKVKEGEYSFSNFTSTLRVVDKDIVYPDFLYYQLKFYYFDGRTLKMQTKTTGLRNLQLNAYLNQRILLPPLQTQQQIVEELDCLTSIIEKQKKQLEELDNLAQAIFYDMFGDPIENEKGWNVKNLDEVCDVRDGTHDSPKYLLYSDYVLITSKNIANGKLDFTNVNYISKSDFDKINLRSKVDKGDILMAMIGTIGNPIIVNSDNINFCIKNMALIKLTPDSLVHRLYLHSLLSSKSFDELVKRINKGGTQKFIALGTIRKLIIPLPPLSLQQEFASKIEAIEKQKELIKKSIKETEDLFNSRKDYYFN